MLWIGSSKVLFKARHMETHRPDLWTKVRHNIAQLSGLVFKKRRNQSERKKEGERANKCKPCKPDIIMKSPNYFDAALDCL